MAHGGKGSRARLLQQLDTDVRSSPWSNEDPGVRALTAHAHDQEWTRTHGPQAATSADQDAESRRLRAGQAQRARGARTRSLAAMRDARAHVGERDATSFTAAGQSRDQLERSLARVPAEAALERGDCTRQGGESERCVRARACLHEVACSVRRCLGLVIARPSLSHLYRCLCAGSSTWRLR